MVCTRDWTEDGKGPLFTFFLDRRLDWGRVMKLWQWRAFFVDWGWWIRNVGTFSSLVCDVWEGGGLEPNRRQWMLEWRKDRERFKGMMKGRVWVKRETRSESQLSE